MFSEKWALLLLAGLVLALIVTNAIYLRNNSAPQPYDAARHLNTALDYREILLERPDGWVQALAGASRYYPPAVPFAAALTTLPFAQSLNKLIAFQTLLFLALVIVTYQIAAARWGPSTGILSAFFLSCYPAIFGLSRLFMLELGLTLCVWIFLGMLLTSGFWKSPYGPLIGGMIAGVGMLTKWSFPIFIVGAVMASFYLAFREKRKDAIRGVLMLALVAAAVATPWYLAHWESVAGLVEGFGFEDSMGKTALKFPVLSLRSLAFYPIQLPMTQITSVLTLFFLFGFAASIAGRVSSRRLFVVWILVPWLLLVLVPLKIPRNSLPLLPGIAMLSALGVLRIRKDWIRRSLVGVAVLAGTLQFFAVSYGWGPAARKIAPFHLGGLEFPLLATTYQSQPAVGPADSRDWGEQRIYASLYRAGWREEDSLWFSGNFMLTAGSLRLHGRLTGLDPNIVDATPMSAPLPEGGFIVATRRMGSGSQTLDPRQTRVTRFLESVEDTTHEIDRFMLPRNVEVVVRAPHQAVPPLPDEGIEN